MNQKMEYLISFNKVDLIKQSTIPKVKNGELVIEIDYDKFSNIEIIKQEKGFFKLKSKYLININENYLTDDFDLIEKITTIEIEDKQTLDKFINDLKQDIGNDNILNNKKTMRNPLVFKENLKLFEIIELSIHRIPLNFDYNEQYIEYKIETFEKIEDIIEKIRDKLPLFKYISIDDFIFIEGIYSHILKIKLLSNIPIRVETNNN
jgi:hypothetical protein